MAPTGLQGRDHAGIALAADRRGRAIRDIVERGLTALARLTGGPASSEDGCPGRSAGILTAIPWDLYAPELPSALRDPAGHRIAAAFLLHPAQADRAIHAARAALGRLGWYVVSWRNVPMRAETLGADCAAQAPHVVQCFGRAERDRHRRTAYRVRLDIEARWRRLGLSGCSVLSLSESTIVYRAATGGAPLSVLFPDLADARFTSPFAVVHARAADGSWTAAQPFHGLAHLGAVVSITANRLWMDARIGDAGIRDESDLTKAGGTAAQALDAAVQWLREAGLTTPQALARLLPPQWEHDAGLPREVRALHRHAACFAEPWDGPAALVFGDGRYAGAVRGRSGSGALHTFEAGDLVCVASDPCAWELSATGSGTHGELACGGMLVADMLTGACLKGDDAWRLMAAGTDHAAASSGVIHRLVPAPTRAIATADAVTARHLDAAVRRAFSLFDCFAERRSRFALAEGTQVSLRTLVGRRGQWTPHALGPLLLELDSPVLLDAEVAAILRQTTVRASILPIGFGAGPASGPLGGELLRTAVRSLQAAAAALVANGTRVLILSDRQLPAGAAPIPLPLATAAVDGKLRSSRLRLRASLIVDSDEIRDGRDAAILAAFGASAVAPRADARDAVEAGLRDALRAAGVSAFEAYVGGRLFEPAGLDRDLAKYFGGAEAAAPEVTVDSLAEALLIRAGGAPVPPTTAVLAPAPA